MQTIAELNFYIDYVSIVTALIVNTMNKKWDERRIDETKFEAALIYNNNNNSYIK